MTMSTEKKQSDSVMQISNLKHYIDGQWAVDICERLETLSAEELDLKNRRTVCICEVPESLSCSKREAYIPQFVGFGPYHHYNHGLMITEEKKLRAAKRVLKVLQRNNMVEFQKRISESGQNILTFYHPDVNSTYNECTLSYILTIDGLFLLGFIMLLNGHNPDVGLSFFLTGNLGVLQFNATGIELTKNALVREVFKLENQIPFHVLDKIRGLHLNNTPSDAVHDQNDLGTNLENFCKQHCPLVQPENLPKNQAPEAYDHLLDLMYHLIVPKPMLQRSTSQTTQTPPTQLTQTTQTPPTQTTQTEIHTETETQPQPQTQSPQPQPLPGSKNEDKRGACFFCFSIFFNIIVVLVTACVILGMIINLILQLFWWLIRSTFRLVRWLLCSVYRLIQKALLPLNGLLLILAEHLNPPLRWLHRGLTENVGKSANPLLIFLKDMVGHLVQITDTVQSTDLEEGVSRTVMIPSVTELHEAGIFFKHFDGSVSSIKFDEEKCVLYLPSIRLNTNSEVIIRNLVAYETLIKSTNPLIFTRYVELMRAIIDTPEDVKILVENEIIKTEFRNDVVADIFNGMSKAIRATDTKELDKVIDKVNRKYNTNRKRNRIVTKYTSGTFLTAIGGFVFLIFTAMQTYCTVYNCSPTSKFAKMPQAGEYGTNNYFISSM